MAYTRIKRLEDTPDNWSAANPILMAAEAGYEKQTDGTYKIKIGDGATHWNDLGYAVDYQAISNAKEATETAASNASDSATVATTAQAAAEAAKEVAEAAKEVAETSASNTLTSETNASNSASSASTSASNASDSATIATTAQAAAEAARDEAVNTVASKADDTAVVHNTGTETIAGIKTLSNGVIGGNGFLATGYDASLIPNGSSGLVMAKIDEDNRLVAVSKDENGVLTYDPINVGAYIGGKYAVVLDTDGTVTCNFDLDAPNLQKDATPTEDSINLVTSGGVAEVIKQAKRAYSKSCFVIKHDAGLLDFSVTNGTGLFWLFPDKTTSTDPHPAKTVSAGTTYLWCDNWVDNTVQLSSGDTRATFTGDLSDLPPLTDYLSISNCSLITGDLSDLPELTDAIGLSNCSLITGSLSNLQALTTYFNLYNCKLITGAYTTVNGNNCPTTTDLSSTGMSATDMDNTLIAYAACTKDNGTLTAGGMTRTAASDDAVANLTGRGWTISGITKV